MTTYARMDVLLLGTLAGEAHAGEYAVAMRCIEPAYLLFSSVSISFYSFLSGSRDESRRVEREDVIRKVFALVTISALVAATGITLWYEEMLRLISPAYSVSGPILVLLSWSLLFRAWNPQLTAVLNSLGKFRIIAGIAVTNLAVSLAMSFVLIPRYGAMGAAIAIIAVEGLNSAVQLSVVSYYEKGFIMKLLAR